MMFRMIRPFLGGMIPKAFSSAWHDAMPCGVGQTPQNRWEIWIASRGFRPIRICSKPRYKVPSHCASVTLPSSRVASIFRCPSMRVIGSMEILVVVVLTAGHLLW